MSTCTTNDGVILEYTDSGGPGIPLVMIHGWGQTQEMFRHQLEGLSDSRRVVTYDQRGHGRSDKPRFGYRIARLAQDFANLISHLDVDTVDVLGWSMGVSVTWSYIDLYGTGSIRNFIAVDQPAAVAAVPWMSHQEQEESGAIFGVEGLLELGAQLNGPNGVAVTEGFVRSMFSGEPRDEVWSLVAREIRTVPAYAGVPLLFDHATQDWRDVLPRVDVPTLVIGCEGSHVAPASQSFIAESIPGARTFIFSSDVANSHFPFLENPEAFNRVVEGFLPAR
ncbi:alpha/beta hydrolase [Microbacterium aoyamense]|uniref:Alpha/beta hydrolase n=1 Tax=Microbacterium aoyamense TaxID=344166 RepID=A0ABP5AQ92_9MICO|nr:alpha/beta hydrolase [Microbacterium aoyamense]